MPSSKNIRALGDGRFVVRYRFGCTSHKRIFNTEAEAKEYVRQEQERIRAFGQLGLRLKGEQFHRVLAMLDRLAPGDLTKAVRCLEEAAALYLEQPASSGKQVTCAMAAESLFKQWATGECSKRTARYHANAGGIIRRFVSSFGERRLIDVTPSDVKEWVLSQAEGIRMTAKARITLLFSHAIEKSWLGAKQNPAQQFTFARRKKTMVIVPTPVEICDFLSLVADEYVVLAPYFLLRLFSGARADEAAVLRWEQIDCERHTISVRQGEVAAKSGPGRSIPISDSLLLWLRAFGQRSGPIAPADVKRLEAQCMAAFRERIGLDAKSPAYAKWRNALRHCYGSYRYPQLKDLSSLAAEMGNSPRVLMTHYIGAVDPEDEVKFWKIVPRSAKDLHPRISSS